MRKRREKTEESKNVQTTPTRTYCKRNRPLPYYLPIVGRSGTGSLLRTIAPPDHPLDSKRENFAPLKVIFFLLSLDFSRKGFFVEDFKLKVTTFVFLSKFAEKHGDVHLYLKLIYDIHGLFSADKEISVLWTISCYT